MFTSTRKFLTLLILCTAAFTIANTDSLRATKKIREGDRSLEGPELELEEVRDPEDRGSLGEDLGPVPEGELQEVHDPDDQGLLEDESEPDVEDDLEEVRDPEDRGALGEDREDHGPLNVFGEPLKKCSEAGMALTGYDKTGYCSDNGDGEDYESVCIDISRTTKEGMVYGVYDFCEVIGETDPNWCDQEHRCHDVDYLRCPIVHWCVGVESLAKFIQLSGGCSKMGYIDCSATNAMTAAHYVAKRMDGEDPDRKFDIALNCIMHRCMNKID